MIADPASLSSGLVRVFDEELQMLLGVFVAKTSVLRIANYIFVLVNTLAIIFFYAMKFSWYTANVHIFYRYTCTSL